MSSKTAWLREVQAENHVWTHFKPQFFKILEKQIKTQWLSVALLEPCSYHVPYSVKCGN